MLRKLLLSTAIVAVSSTASMAADAVPIDDPVPPVIDNARFDWGGLYVGAFVAFPLGTGNWAERSVAAASTPDDYSGTLYGATIGYNHQFSNNLIVGIEADYSLGDVELNSPSSAASPSSPAFACGVNTCDINVSNFWTARGRLGYAFDRLLPYVTGGWAHANARASAVGFGTLIEDHMSGFVWGGGVEYAFNNNWTIKAEYLHADLGRLEITAPCATNCYSDIVLETVKIGINYKF